MNALTDLWNAFTQTKTESNQQNKENNQNTNIMSNDIPTGTQNPNEVTQKAFIERAHENRFNAAHFNEPLTVFSSGYQDPENLGALLEFIAPTVPVARRFEFKKADNHNAFLSEVDDIRAIGSHFKRVEYAGTSVNEKTLNKGLTMRVDHDEISRDDWQERAVQLLIQRLLRNDLRRTVSALEQSQALQEISWGKTSNPDKDLRDALIRGSQASGIRPNRILFGEGAWDARSSTFEMKDHAAGIYAAQTGPVQLASKLLVDEIRILRARYQKADGLKENFLGNRIYAFYAQNELTKDEPSNLKRFVTFHEGTTGPFRVYLEEHAKYTDLTVEHYSNIVVTSQLGIQHLSIKPGNN